MKISVLFLDFENQKQLFHKAFENYCITCLTKCFHFNLTS